MQLLDDPRLSVRVSVIELLSAARHAAFEAMLPELLNNASTDIQDAARRAMRRIERQGQAANDQAAPNVLATPGHSLK